jgi:hypothetical protein
MMTMIIRDFEVDGRTYYHRTVLPIMEKENAEVATIIEGEDVYYYSAHQTQYNLSKMERVGVEQ